MWNPEGKSIEENAVCLFHNVDCSEDERGEKSISYVKYCTCDYCKFDDLELICA